jgi:hypothetical protein
MVMTAVPALDRTSATFKADVDTFFGSRMPTFVTEANALEANVVSKESTATSAASTATTQAGIATTKAGLTAADAIATAADRVQTGLDRIAAAASAAAASGSAAFVDTNPIVKGSVDATKQVRLEVDGLTTATTRVLTVPDADLTLVGAATAQTLTNKTLTGYTETVYALSGTAIDPANGTVQTKTLSTNTTFTESLADGQSVVLMLNPSTYTTTWPSAPAVSWVTAAGGGTAPTLKASVVNTIVLWQVGGVLYGNWAGSL